MLEERVISLETKIREIEARLLGHVPPLADPPPVEVEDDTDAPSQED